MKKIMLTLFAGLLLHTAGCSYYHIISDSRPTGDIRSYDTVNIGWLDLGENKWRDYGFEDKDKRNWLSLINTMNKQSMPEYMGQCIPNKKITVAASKNAEPKKEGLVIKFSDAIYAQRTSSGAQVMFGPMAGSDTLDVTIHFIDGKSSKEIHAVRVSIYAKSGSGFADMSFEGRVNNGIYNLAYFISKRLK